MSIINPAVTLVVINKTPCTEIDTVKMGGKVGMSRRLLPTRSFSPIETRQIPHIRHFLRPTGSLPHFTQDAL